VSTMHFIQDYSRSKFINCDQIVSIRKINMKSNTGYEDQWFVKDISGDITRISVYSLKKLLDWPAGYVFWSSEEDKERGLDGIEIPEF